MQPCWSYSGVGGCRHWGEMGLSPSNGEEQSPINIDTHSCSCVGASGMTLSVNPLGQLNGLIKNTGFTPKVELKDKKSHINIDGDDYALVQFHFHSPTEHTVDGVFYPLELHLVHESIKRKGQLAVIAVLFEVGNNSEFMESILPLIPERKNCSEPLREPLSLRGLKLEPKYWNYKGSLTTPPCTEGVKWIVMKKTHSLSRQQLAVYLDLFPMNTNRPVQPLNHRVVRSVN